MGANVLCSGFDHNFQRREGVDRNAAANFRLTVRSGKHSEQTSGCAAGFLQANFVAVPKEMAFDFLLFCLRNPKPCPLLEVIDDGKKEPLALAPGADITTDIPRWLIAHSFYLLFLTKLCRYRVYHDGVVVEERDSVSDLWSGSKTDQGSDGSKDRFGKLSMVGFLLGCSFSWEQALVDAGLTPRHIEECRNVPM